MPDTECPLHKPRQRPAGPFPLALGWVLGAAVQLQQAALWPALAYAALLLPAGALAGMLWRRRRVHGSARGRMVAWCVLALALGFAVTGLRAVVFAAHALEPAWEGRDVRVTGLVSDMPQHSAAGLRFTLAVESAVLDGAPVQLPAQIDVGWYGRAAPFADALQDPQRVPADVWAGQRWSMTLRLKAPHGSRNPHGFDYELWMWERGVQASGYVRAGAADPAPELLGQSYRYPVAWLRQAVRERIAMHVSQRQSAGLIAALVVGDQNAIEREDWDVFRATGVAHLVSISGLHITMFAWAASGFLGWLWRQSARLCLLRPAPDAALLGGMLLALGYAVFSGWGIPAQRTCVMLGLLTFLRWSGVRWPWPQTWMLACAAVVATDPWALLQPGFWLSFVAVGVLFASGSPARPIASAHGWARRTGARGLALLREQAVVTVALAPLTLLLFGQVSLVGLLANLLAIPWVTLLITPLSLLGVLWPALWDGAASALAVLMACLQWMAGLPWASLSLAVAPWGLAAAGGAGAMLLVVRLPWHLRCLGVPMLLPVLLWQAPLPAAGEFELLAADVGQGNAVLVRTAQHALLYDTGPRYSADSDAGHRVLLPLLRALQTQLDIVLVSHRDVDHSGGAEAVLRMHSQASLVSSIDADDRLQAVRPAQPCVAGQHWEWDGVRFDILHPQAQDYAPPAKPNAMSCVLRIQSAGRRPQVALLAGDIESAQEAALLAAGAPLKADLLLVPHHGSKTSSSDAFLDAVQPREAWVQAGYRNRYGHPAPAVMQRYAQRNIVVRETPRCGAMRWQSQAAQASVCTRAESPHYWSHVLP